MDNPYIKRLIASLSDTDVEIRIDAIEELGRQRATEAVGPIAGVLSHGCQELKIAAAIALGEIGDTAAVPSLIEAMADKDLYIEGYRYSAPSSFAADALRSIGGEAVVIPLMKIWSAAQSDVQYYILEILAETCEQVAPEVIMAEPEAVSSVLEVFGGVMCLDGEDEERAMEHLITTIGVSNLAGQYAPRLRDPDPEVRKAVIFMLSELGAFEPGAVVPMIVESFVDGDAGVRVQVVRAVRMLCAGADGQLATDARLLFDRAASDPDPSVRDEAAKRQD